MKDLIIEKFGRKLRKKNLPAAKLVDATTMLSEIITDAHRFWRIAVGLFPEDLWNLIKQPKMKSELGPLVHSICKYIRQLIQSHIWHPRNKIAMQLEKSMNITFLTKRPSNKKPHYRTGLSHKTKAIEPQDIPPDLVRSIELWIWKGVSYLGQ